MKSTRLTNGLSFVRRSAWNKRFNINQKSPLGGCRDKRQPLFFVYTQLWNFLTLLCYIDFGRIPNNVKIVNRRCDTDVLTEFEICRVVYNR